MLLVEQELLTIPEYLSYPRSSCRVGVAQFIVFCVVFLRSLFVILSCDFWLLYCHSIYGFYGLRLMHLLFLVSQTIMFLLLTSVTSNCVCFFEAVVAVIQLPMQSVPITTDVASSNLVHGEVYNIM